MTEAAVKRVRRKYYFLSSLHAGANSIHFGTLILSLTAATGDLKFGFLAFFLQQPIESISELATGYFADKRGRRNSVRWGFALLTLSGLALSTATGFIGGEPSWIALILGQILFLSGTAFISGAIDAWAVDRLHWAAGGPVDTSRTFAFVNLLRNASVFLVGALSIRLAISADWFQAPWLIAAAIFAILTVAAHCWMDEPYSRSIVANESPGVFFRRSRDIVFKKGPVRGLTLLWSSQYCCWALLTYFWLRFLAESNGLSERFEMGAGDKGPKILFGAWAVWCGMRVVAGLVTVLFVRSRFFSTRHSRHAMSLLAIAGPCLALAFVAPALGFAHLPLWWAGLMAILVKGTEMMLLPLRNATLNEHLESQHRAMCLSCSMAGGTFVAFLILGLVIARMGRIPNTAQEMAYAILLSGLVALAGGCFFIREIYRNTCD